MKNIFVLCSSSESFFATFSGSCLGRNSWVSTSLGILGMNSCRRALLRCFPCCQFSSSWSDRDLGDWDKELDRDGWTGLAFLIRVSGRCQVHGLHCTVPGQCHVMLLLCSSAQQQSKYRTGVPIYARGQKKDKSIPLTPVFWAWIDGGWWCCCNINIDKQNDRDNSCNIMVIGNHGKCWSVKQRKGEMSLDGVWFSG